MVQLVHNYQVYICLTSQDSCGSLCVELDSTRVPQNDGISSTQYVGSCIPTCSTNHDITGGGADEVDGLLRHAKLETIHWVSVMDGLQRVIMFTEDKSVADLTRKVFSAVSTSVIL